MRVQRKMKKEEKKVGKTKKKRGIIAFIPQKLIASTIIHRIYHERNSPSACVCRVRVYNLLSLRVTKNAFTDSFAGA